MYMAITIDIIEIIIITLMWKTMKHADGENLQI